MTYYQYPRDEIKPFIPENHSNILEIGCGNGVFRKQFSKPNTYWGIEPNKQAAELARDALDEVLNLPFEQAFEQLPDHHFDLIVCNDVIEHMPDTDLFLQNIQQKMSAGACIIGSVPNIRYFRQLFELLVKRDWKYKSAGILDNTHLRFYTYRSFERTLRENDLSIERLSGINMNRPANILKRFILILVGLVLGRDTLYPQMAFRVSKK